MPGMLGWNTQLQVTVSSTTHTFQYGLSLSTPQFDIVRVEVTNFDTPTLQSEYIPGFQENGNCEFTGLYHETDFLFLAGIAGEEHTWVITLPDGVTCTFPGFCNLPNARPAAKDRIEMSFQLTVTGEVVYA